ncbi:hypothetical protein HPP92_017730 [Vanilla planifolia]|uniref:Uncharacterized protein n=1 Tax=Vanilla planifolia TaxID=51239 RepID=A0A835UMN6_VANPL|nr:hypothetical protein HPP92_017730 [Vanilla planifolia]
MERIIDPQELELSLGCRRYNSPSSSNSKWEEQRRPLQQMTIFYKDGMRDSNVAGQQARAIIEMAKKEILTTIAEINDGEDQPSFPAVAAEVEERREVRNPGLLMKRSLQRFLEKRKARMASYRSDYAFRQPLQLFSSFS